MSTDQVPGTALDERSRAQVQAALAAQAGQPGPLLHVLHEVQNRLGHVPAAAIALIADALNLSRAEVHGVVTFYPHFRSAPAGRHLIQICQAEACRAMHCEQLMEHARDTLGVAPRDTRTDGCYTLEPVYCLGICACAPAVMIDGEPHGRVTPETFDVLIASLT
jgi:formate dehydrogenase subunit gamma